MPTANFYEVLAAYKRNQRQCFIDREVLENHQRRLLHRLLKETLPLSPFYAKLLGTPMSSWPIINSRVLAQHFDQINTAGISKNEAFATAFRAEVARDFSRYVQLNGYTPLLSSGTKDKRKPFIINHAEQIDRIGEILARIFPAGLNTKTSIAYFFRSNNAPYFSMNSDVIAFQPYDLFESLPRLLARLAQQQPDIIIAPVSVLLYIAKQRAAGAIHLSAISKVYCVGEVLTARDKCLLRRAFAEVGEIYYAAEGLLGMTCEYGRLHLNEEKYFIEQEWLDNHRYIPVITALNATGLPLVRYRQDDILYADPYPCPCGRVTKTVRFIEGRLDDVLILPGRHHKRINVYPNSCHAVFAGALTHDSEYRLIQTAPREIILSIQGKPHQLQTCCAYLQSTWHNIGVDTARLHWHISQMPAEHHQVNEKQRRIQRLAFALPAEYKTSTTNTPLHRAGKVKNTSATKENII